MLTIDTCKSSNYVHGNNFMTFLVAIWCSWCSHGFVDSCNGVIDSSLRFNRCVWTSWSSTNTFDVFFGLVFERHNPLGALDFGGSIYWCI